MMKVGKFLISSVFRHSLGGLFYPRPGSVAGKLEILQRAETAQVAFKQVQEMQVRASSQIFG